MSVPFTPSIIRSNRKTLAIQITPKGEVVVRAPLRMSGERIRAFVEEKRPWIEKHLTVALTAAGEPPFTAEEIAAMGRRACELLPPLVQKYAPLVGVTYGRITIRSQRSRWGSCSSAGNLNFNCLLTLCPEEIRAYVVIHELCHRLHMDHSPAFWNEVARVCPDWESCRSWLKTEGAGLIRRLG